MTVTVFGTNSVMMAGRIMGHVSFREAYSGGNAFDTCQFLMMIPDPWRREEGGGLLVRVMLRSDNALQAAKYSAGARVLIEGFATLPDDGPHKILLVGRKFQPLDPPSPTQDNEHFDDPEPPPRGGDPRFY